MNNVPEQAFENLIERLSCIKLQAQTILVLAPDASQVQALYPSALVHTAFASTVTYDLIVQHMLMDPDLLAHYAEQLSSEGLLLFSMLGPDTGMEVGLETPFLDMHLIGDALQKLGFSDPVMDRDTMQIIYRNKTSLIRDWGETNAQPTDEGYYPVTYELIYGHAWGVKAAATETSFPISQLRRITEL